MAGTPGRRRAIHGVVVALALLPAVGLAVGAATNRLGANPIEEITHVTGEWALRLLLGCLAVTPLRRAFGWPALAPYRRTLGLLAFTYACLHVATFVGLDHFFDGTALLEDVFERPFVTAGLASFLAMLPLALTSTRGAMRRLGRRWVRLHWLAYPAAVAAVVHFLWLVKADLRAPLLHGVVLALLLGARVLRRGPRSPTPSEG